MTREIAPIDVMAAFEVNPPELDFVIPGLLSGTVGVIYSPGGVGKSFLALEIMASVAGVDLLGLGLHNTGRSLYIALEDPAIVLRRRLHAIGEHLSISQREIFAVKVEILPMMGVPFDLLSQDGLYADWLNKRAAEARLVVIDTLSRAHSGDESSNGEMAQLLRVLERICVSTGAAILFLHHVNKGSGRDRNGDQFSIRGASALVDNARFAAAITYELEDDNPAARVRIRYSVSKNNYAALIAPRYFVRHAGGVLLPEPQELRQDHKRKASPDRQTPSGSPYLAAKNGEPHAW